MPRVVDAEQRRAELVELTAAEIARDGLEQLTLRGLARAGGWTTGIVTHYFVDKRDLLIETFRSRADAARRRVEVARAAGATALEAIIDSALPLDGERLANWKVWLAFWGAAVGDDELTAVQLERHRSFVDTIERALEAERSARRLRVDVDIAYEARRLVALLDGVAVQAVFQPDRWPPEEQRRMIDDHLTPLRAS
jgi:AcrR family transcriptional regulator